MKPPEFEYARPTSVTEAVAQLADAAGDAKLLAGGQSLVPLLNFRLAAPSVLVDLNGIPALSFVESTDGLLRIGAMTRMRTLETDATVARVIPLLAEAAGWVGHVQIRNRGTVGGSLAHADPAAEIPAICVLLDAELVAQGPRGERTIAAADFFAGFLTTTLEEDEVLTEIRVPVPSPGERTGFREFAHRRGDFALAGAAVTLSGAPGAAIERARVVVFGTSDRPVRIASVERELEGQSMTDESFAEAASAIAADATRDDPRPDAAYRRGLIQAMVRRALVDARGPSDGTARRDARSAAA
jgi:aerobic carbon-monoxide dehydrogenase medium subunit